MRILIILLCFLFSVSVSTGTGYSFVKGIPIGGPSLIHPAPSEEFSKGYAPSIQALAATPEGVIYAGTFGMGMFRSDDRGQNWELWSAGLEDPFLLCLALVPGEHLYAGTVRGGVFRVKLGGATWESVRKGLEDVEVKSFVVRQGKIFSGTGKGVFRWEEDAKEWTRVGRGLDQTLVSGLAFLDDRTLLAATAGRGVLHFNVQGSLEAEWVDFESEFIDPKERLPHRYLRVITVNDDHHIFLGTQNGGIFLSRDRGRNWEPIGRRLPNDSIRSIVPIGKDLVVGTGNGIFQWVQEKRRWIPLNQGLVHKAIQSLIITPTHDVYAGTSRGAFRSVDGGAHWVDVSGGFGVQHTPKGPYQ